MSPRNTGELILTRLKQLGVEKFFANPGTEFISVIRGFQDLLPGEVPEPVMAPHEFLGVGMAYGYYLATGKAQAVMTHANVGAANALIGLIGAARMNIPMIFISGMTAKTETGAGRRDKLIHWAQDSKDQGSIFREYVKWEAEISDASQAADLLDRAYAIAMSPPYGPVAIKVSRDILLEKDFTPPKGPAVSSYSHVRPSLDDLERVKDWIIKAGRPLIVTNRLGADPAAVSLLARICSEQDIAVLTPDDYYMSFPSDHDSHVGHKKSAALSEADLVLVLDSDVPWYPLFEGPNPKANVVHVGADPLFQQIPLRSHSGNLFIQCGARSFLEEIAGVFPEKELLAARKNWIRRHRLKVKDEAGEFLNARSVSTLLSEFQSESTILLNELGLAPEHLRQRYSGNYFRSGSASPLGWAMGCALGLKQAHKDKNVIAAIGDGVFYLSPVLAALQTSIAQGAPFITLVLNNGGMNSIAGTVVEFFPETKFKGPLTSFNSVAFEQCAAMVNGLGLKATTVSELRRQLQKAIEFTEREKRPAIINVVYSN